MASTSTNLSVNSVNNEINGAVNGAVNGVVSDVVSDVVGVAVAVKKRGQGKPMKFVAIYDEYADAYKSIISGDGFDGRKWVELNTKTNRKGATVWFRCVE
jgi:hypothetical protein